MKGIDVFRKYFREYQDQYVLIGGAACDLLLAQTAIAPRVTKDLDIVLIVEALTPEFGRRLWEFIKEGGYKNRAKSNGSPQHYRFDEPTNSEFPFMIELLSRQEGLLIDDGEIIPMTLGDSISSMSAILLNHEYYKLLFEGRQMISDVVVLSPEYLLVFKVKAWLDLTERKINGEYINSHDISKHISDVIRLAASFSGDAHCELPEVVLADMKKFIKHFESMSVDPRSLKIKGITSDDILSVIRKVYLP